MGKPVFRTLTLSHYYVEKEDNLKRTTKIPNTKQADGWGVPDPPRPQWHSNAEPDFSQFGESGCCSDPVEMVKQFLTKKHGPTEAMRQLKVMSGWDVVALADRLKTEFDENTTKIARKEGQYEEYSAPKMRW